MAIFMVSIGTIDTLIQGFAFVSFLFYMLSIAAVVILRVTHGKEPRLFKVGQFAVIYLSHSTAEMSKKPFLSG